MSTIKRHACVHTILEALEGCRSRKKTAGSSSDLKALAWVDLVAVVVDLSFDPARPGRTPNASVWIRDSSLAQDDRVFISYWGPKALEILDRRAGLRVGDIVC